MANLARCPLCGTECEIVSDEGTNYYRPLAEDRIRELETEIGRHNMCLDSDAAREIESACAEKDIALRGIREYLTTDAATYYVSHGDYDPMQSVTKALSSEAGKGILAENIQKEHERVLALKGWSQAKAELEQARAERDAAMDAGMDLTRRLTDACLELERAKAENKKLYLELREANRRSINLADEGLMRPRPRMHGCGSCCARW